MKAARRRVAKLKLGSHEFIPGFEEQLVGVKAGDEKDLEVTFPIDYPGDKLAGPTICIGSCASMAAVLLTAGEKGKRYALPHASVMIHQPLGGAQGQATDIAIHAKEIIRLRSELNGIIAAHSGQTLKTVMKDTERDNFMTADAALKYGLIDKILTRNELAELNGKSELSKK